MYLALMIDNKVNKTEKRGKEERTGRGKMGGSKRRKNKNMPFIATTTLSIVRQKEWLPV